MFIPSRQYTRLNLQQRHLIIAANPNPPMFYGEYHSSTGAYIPSHGIDVSFLHLMSLYFNFTYTIADQGGQWGLEPEEEGPNGPVYSGLLGAVISGNATFGIGAVSTRLRFGKEELIQFTTPNLETKITFLMMEAPRVPLTNVLLRPMAWLEWTLFLCLMACILVTGRVITIVAKSSTDLDWLALGSFLQKAPRLSTHSQSAAGHLLLQISWFAGFFLLGVYGGVLISFLTRSFKLGNVDDLRVFNRLVASGQITPLVITSSTFVYDFKHYINSKTFSILLQHMEPVSTYREGFLKITRERRIHPERKYALIGQYMVMQKWAEHLGEEYFHLSESLETNIFTDNYGLVFKCGSPLTGHFDRFIRIATEAGLFVRWSTVKYKWISRRKEIQEQLKAATDTLDYEANDSVVSYDQLGLVHVDEHFYFLFIGSIVAMLVFAGEIYIAVRWWSR